MRTLFDDQWRFHIGDMADAHLPDLDDTAWRILDLPHDGSVEQPFSPEHASGTGYLPAGIGWYRKPFTLSDRGADEEVCIEFDGVYRNSDVWINGHHLGHRPYGYSSFQYRLTPHLRHEGENVIAVRVERENAADSRWYPGTGIYRHTWLTRTGPVRVAPWGVFVTTPRVRDDQADVHVSIDLSNLSPTPRNLRVVTEVRNRRGEVLATDASLVEAEGESSVTATHGHVVAHPECWSPASPALYSLVARILDGAACLDEVSVPFGIRNFRFDADRGFVLNGEPATLRGVCMHHDAGMVGAAVPEPVLERRLRRVRELGANAVRCSHNPMAPEFYDLCDRLGLLVMDEAFDEWELGKRKWKEGRNVGRAGRFGYAEAFESWCERDCADMVRRNRNHPSVILWSIGNEIDYPGDPYVHPEFFDPGAPPADADSPRMSRLPAVAPRLIAAVKRHDPTRPVTMALSNLPSANAVGLAQLLDVVGYNYQEQYYLEDHDGYPGRVILGSENGRGPGPWHAVTDHPFVGGQFIWVGFDFLGEAGPWPNHASQAGLFDTRAFRKPAGWLQQALWREEPLVRLFVLDAGEQHPDRLSVAAHPRRWSGALGEPVRLAVVGNCETVEVRLNGRTVTCETPGIRGWFTMDLPFAPGRLEATGRRAGYDDAGDRLETTGPVRSLTCKLLDQGRTAAGREISQVEIRALDKDGRLVTDTDIELTATLGGPAHLVGLDNGDTYDPTPLTSPIRRLRDGRMLALALAPPDEETAETVLTVENRASGLRGSIVLFTSPKSGSPPTCSEKPATLTKSDTP